MKQVKRSIIIIIIVVKEEEEEEEVVVVVVFLQRRSTGLRPDNLNHMRTYTATRGQRHRPAEEQEELLA